MRAAGLLLAIALCAVALAARADTFAYLQIEANEGGSSGGHAAVQLSDGVYHFQNRHGLLLLSREAPLRFIHDYAGLDNRPIHVLTISVSPDTRSRIDRAFRSRLQTQQAQLDLREGLRQESALLAALLRRIRGEPPRARDALAIPGLGYFAEGGARAHVPEEPCLATLRDRIRERRGASFLGRRMAELRDELAAMPPAASRDVEPPRDAYAFPRLHNGYGRRYAALIAEIAALDVLREARPLAPGTFRELPPGMLPLGPHERSQLQRLALRLDAGLERLASSREAGWGSALLVGMARRAALERSLATGRMVVLDAFPKTAPTIPAHELAGERDLLSEARSEAGLTLERAATAFFGAERPDERFYADLEDAANRSLELEAAWRDAAPLRIDPARLVPRRSALWRDLPVPRTGAPALERAATASRGVLRRYDRGLARLYDYGLVTRNCVSELFATLYHGLGGRRDEIRRLLGGYVDPGRSLAFIPFVSREDVRRRFHVAAVHEIPSYREVVLERLRRREGRLRVALLESNTLTARSYRWNSRDSFFLFFTDGPALLRPLGGAVNLVAGLARAVTGLLTLPFDRGAGLASGAEGALLSLPELAMVDLRKGTNPFVSTRDARLLAGREVSSAGTSP